MELKLGTITDLEGNLSKLNKILYKFKKENIKVLVLAGDIPSDKKDSLSKILKKCILLKVPILIIPGSHETFESYDKQIKKVRSRFIIDGIKTPKIKIEGYEFIFVPGSDYLASGAQYPLFDSKFENKKHARKRKRNIRHFKSTKFKGSYLTQIDNRINSTKKTIIISHVPPKFNKREAIDVAIFGKATRDFTLKKFDLRKETVKKFPWLLIEGFKKTGGIITYDEARNLAKKRYPIKIVNKNVGNKKLKRIIKEKKVKFLICGHIHESGNKACDSKGNLIPINKYSKELFLNSGEADKGKVCIVTFRDDKAKYKKIIV